MAKQDKSVKNFPNLRFPGFTDEWEVKKLGEIGEVINGLTYSPNDIDDKGVLVLRSSNVQNRIVTFQDNVFVKTETFNPVKENDILICVRNGSKNLIGKNAIINKENEGLAFGAFMTVYRSPYNKFVFQWFGTQVYKEIVHKNLGATINSINGSDLKKFVIPLPSISEQEKISSFLSSIDQRIITQRKTILELESLMKGLRSKIFSQKLRFKGQNGDEFSKWELKTLAEICEKKSSNISTNKIEDNFGEYNIYGASGLLKKIDFYDEENNYISIVKDGAGVGRLFFCEGKSSVLGTMEIIKPQVGINTYFLYCVLSNIDFTKYVTGSTIPHIYFKDYKKEKLKVPSNNEQLKISKFLSLISDKIENEKRILQEFETQKKHLLSNLFI